MEQEAVKKLLGAELLAKLKEHSLDTTLLPLLEDKKVLLDDGHYVRSDSGDYVPREKMNELTKKHKEQTEEFTTQIETLEKSVKDGGNAAEEIEKLKLGRKEVDKTNNAEMKALKIRHAIDLEIVKAKPREPHFVDYLRMQIDETKVTLGDDGVTVFGVKDQLDTLREDPKHKDFFGEKSVIGAAPKLGKTIGDPTAAKQAQKEYEAAVTQFGPSSAQAIALKNQMFTPEPLPNPHVEPTE